MDACNRTDAPTGRYGLRTACWLRASHATTPTLELALDGLPTLRLARHGDYVHVLYDVDAWREQALTRDDVVARVRAALFLAEIGHDLALGRFVCETDDRLLDVEELKRVRDPH